MNVKSEGLTIYKFQLTDKKKKYKEVIGYEIHVQHLANADIEIITNTLQGLIDEV